MCLGFIVRKGTSISKFALLEKLLQIKTLLLPPSFLASYLSVPRLWALFWRSLFLRVFMKYSISSCCVFKNTAGIGIKRTINQLNENSGVLSFKSTSINQNLTCLSLRSFLFVCCFFETWKVLWHVVYFLKVTVCNNTIRDQWTKRCNKSIHVWAGRGKAMPKVGAPTFRYVIVSPSSRLCIEPLIHRYLAVQRQWRMKEALTAWTYGNR